MPLRSFTPAERMLTERRRFERLLFLLVWVSVAAFSVVEGTYFHLVAGTVAVAVNLWAANRAKEVYIARALVNATVLLAVGILAVEILVAEAAFLIALAHFLILIQLCKLFEHKANRDYAELLVLSVMLIVATTLLSESLLLAALLLVHAAMTCYTMMALTLKRGLDAASSARLSSESGPIAPRRVAWNVTRAWPVRALRGRLAWAMTGVVATGVLAFMVVPRAPIRAASLPGGARRAARTGYTSTVRLGDVDRIYQSDRVVMRMRLSGADGSSYVSDGPIYLLGKTCSAYASSRWIGLDHAGSKGLPVEAPPIGAMRAMGRTVVQEIAMDGSLLPALFAMRPVLGVRTSDGNTAKMYPDDEIAPANRKAAFVRYRAYSWAQPLSAEQASFLLQRQAFVLAGEVEVTESVRELARRWAGDLLRNRPPAFSPNRGRRDLAIARRIAARLRAEYAYSLSPPRKAPGRDGIEHFLFSARRGHCEYFASALTAMCRSLDVPARLAMGFRVDPSNREAGEYIVRSRDAHAWTEVYAPRTGWVVVDATPAGSLRRPDSWWAPVRNFWTRLDFAWREHVAGYDNSSRRALLDRVIDWFAAAMAEIRGAAGAVRDSFVNLLVRGVIDRVILGLMLALGLAGLALEVLIVVRIFRRSARGGSAAPPAIRGVRFARKLFALFRRHGAGRRVDQSPRAAATSAAQRLHLPAEPVRDLLDLYYRIRWGKETPSARRLERADRQVAELRRQLSERR